MYSSLIKKDFLSRAQHSQNDYGFLHETHVLITGATGAIGSYLVYALDVIRTERNIDIQILVQGRSLEKLKGLFGALSSLTYVVGDVTEAIHYEGRIDHIIHCASITHSKTMVESPVDVIRTGVMGSNHILELAREKEIQSMVYLSSMEVYGSFGQGTTHVTEEMLGFLPLDSVRTCYPESKRMCENLCVSYASQYQVPVKIARLAQTFGACVSKEDTRVFAQFARSVQKKENIVLHTTGETIGNYCDTSDAVSGILLLLDKGNNGEAYNISNEKNAMSIKEMAELVGKKADITVEIQLQDQSIYPPHSSNVLDASKIKKLGWVPIYSLEEMYVKLLEGWNHA